MWQRLALLALPAIVAGCAASLLKSSKPDKAQPADVPTTKPETVPESPGDTFACNPANLETLLVNQKFEVEGVTTLSALNRYDLLLKIPASGGRPPYAVHLFSTVLAETSAKRRSCFPREGERHSIFAWGPVGFSEWEPNCCQERSQDICFKDLEEGLDRLASQKRDSFLRSHADRFDALRSKATILSYAQRRPVDEFFTGWVGSNMMVGLPEDSSNVGFETVEDGETGMTYVAYYADYNDIGMAPPVYFAGFRKGETIFIVDNAHLVPIKTK